MPTRTIHSEGADLVHDVEGTGPLLLLITGGGGDAARYAGVAAQLAGTCTVVRYDRRANFRSGGDRHRDLDMRQQARDAAAIIRSLGEEALVFGNSGGANIGLQLVLDDPRVVRALVAHEPPVMGLLPDSGEWFAYIDRIYALYLEQGPLYAMQRFTSDIVGTEPVDPGRDPGTYSHEPADDWEFFLAHEYRPISKYTPDLGGLTGSTTPIALAAGVDSGDAYYARTARLVAERCGLPFVEFPGHHTSHNNPDRYAPAIRSAFSRLGQGAL
ncbi:alpha/beta fold hydrolase [Kineococcus sp. SYSU DK002]|uniref:alpha/beta fold hydrolase n=1 Tax=Kineococcus sp. SYSU DK002 TaxID=3383123 RepID=UPI003D7EA58C